jgi:hypothetical protein
LNGAL